MIVLLGPINGEFGPFLLVARPPGWSFDARSELRQQLASTFGRFTVENLG
jgi:hypothetical protein